MPKPLIALPAAHLTHKGRVPDYEISEMYVKAVLSAGGLPVLLPTNFPESNWPRLVESFDGFLYTGGGDVDPIHYGGEVSPNDYGFSEERDRFELGLIPLILSADKPLLCICRGVQVLNVGMGGTLIGDIKSELPEAGRHNWYPNFAREKRVHEVDLVAETKLAQLFDQNRVWTNSLHHQALKQVGEGLMVNARAGDGVIEGIELPGHRFVMGVQWHPEHLQDDPGMHALFEGLVEAAK